MGTQKALFMLVFAMLLAGVRSAKARTAEALPEMRLAAEPQRAQAVQSYREWKNNRIQDVQNRINALRTQIETRRLKRDIATGQDPNLKNFRRVSAPVVSSDPQVEKWERQLDQEKYSLELAKDLSVSDYFAGYLTKVPDKKAAFNEVAGKLSAEEVAELMNAYANSVFGTHAGDIPASATNLSHESVK
jgi:hypothetical protein